jgi:hypothetical protein
MVNEVGEALALVLALAEVELEVELELELEHPAVPSRLAATTVAPNRKAVRRLKMFIENFYSLRMTHDKTESNAQVNDVWPLW